MCFIDRMTVGIAYPQYPPSCPPVLLVGPQFEDAIRKQREHIGNWMKYSAWEESQKEFERSRSVYERALEVDYRNQVSALLFVSLQHFPGKIKSEHYTDSKQCYRFVYKVWFSSAWGGGRRPITTCNPCGAPLFYRVV